MPLLFRTLWGFFRRDAAIHTSYKLGFVMDLGSVFFSAATFYFVAKVFGAAAAPMLAHYGGDYFSFVLIGIAFATYQNVGLNSFSQALRQEQFLNTLEPLMMSPVRLPTFLLGSALWDFLNATLEVLLYMALGLFLFGFRAPSANVPAALAVLAMTLFAFMGLGIFAASFIMRFKRGNPVTWLMATSSELLGGVYFPPEALPRGLRVLSKFVPMSYALSGLRKSLLTGAGWSQISGELLALGVFVLIMWPVGVLCFAWALRKAQEDGSLGHY
jgi:ABC-2 type transport system permease protein